MYDGDVPRRGGAARLFIECPARPGPARFSLVVEHRVKGAAAHSLSSFISSGIARTVVPAPNEQQLFGYVLSTGWQSLTFSLSTTFGAPSMLIARPVIGQRAADHDGLGLVHLVACRS